MAIASRPSPSPSRQAARRRRTVTCAPSASVPGMMIGELVATHPERAIGTTQVGRDGGCRAAQQPVADRVPAGIVDPLEVVEVLEDREREGLAVADGHRPLALHLLLERPVVAEPGQCVAQRLCARPVVGVLEDPARLFETFRGLQDAARQPDGEAAKDDGEGHQAKGRHDQRGPEPPRQAVDHRRRH